MNDKGQFIVQPRAESKLIRARWWLVAACVGFILLASTGLMSAERTGQAIKRVIQWAVPDANPEQVRQLNVVIRKTAHLLEYAALAWMTAWAMIAAVPWTKSGAWFFLALMLTALVAVFDEFHQSFVPTRTGAVRDVGIDICGGMFALTAIALWRLRRSRQAAHSLAPLYATTPEIADAE